MTRRGVTGERLAALFLLGVALLAPPWLGIFNRPVQVLGLPLLYVYLFAAWGILIGLTALIVDAGAADEAFRDDADDSAAGTADQRPPP